MTTSTKNSSSDNEKGIVMSDAVKNVEDFLRQYSDGFGRDDAIATIVGSGEMARLTATDVRTILDELSKVKAENERLRKSIEAFPDPAFYEVGEFPKEFEKWLNDRKGGA